MSLQKYRADEERAAEKNGSVPFYTRWVGGPTLALVKNCPVKIKFRPAVNEPCTSEDTISPRTVYVQGEPDTFFSLPAACRWKGKDVRGYLTYETGEGFSFTGFAIVKE